MRSRWCLVEVDCGVISPRMSFNIKTGFLWSNLHGETHIKLSLCALIICANNWTPSSAQYLVGTMIAADVRFETRMTTDNLLFKGQVAIIKYLKYSQNCYFILGSARIMVGKIGTVMKPRKVSKSAKLRGASIWDSGSSRHCQNHRQHNCLQNHNHHA